MFSLQDPSDLIHYRALGPCVSKRTGRSPQNSSFNWSVRSLVFGEAGTRLTFLCVRQGGREDEVEQRIDELVAK